MNRPLWAPWRMKFIRSARPDGCFLCGLENPSGREEEKLVVHRGKTVFAMLNAFPYNSGHVLIAPYRHAGDLDRLSAEERAELMETAVFLEKVLKKLMSPDAFNLGFNLGKAAGAGVADHLHWHLVPRWNGDTNFMPVIADTRCVPESLENTAEMIRKTICTSE